jgi:putative CocE/NonD family hydrolase
MRTFRKRLLPMGLLLIAVGAGAWYWAEGQLNGTEAHYTKREFRIPMRDGVKLFTQVYMPKDTSRAYPFLIMRTPFGVAPYGESHFRRQLGPAQSFDRSGYIFVFQDVRGRYQSEGSFVDMRSHIENPAPGQTDESTDAHDSIDWLLRNSNGNNGKAGIWGVSYPGFYAASSIINSHPAIQAASPEAPMTDLFHGDDAYQNGAFMLAEQFLLYSNYFWIRSDGPDMPPSHPGHAFDYGTADGYDFFLRNGPALSRFKALIHNPLFDQNVNHNTYDDYWRARNNAPYLKNVHCPVLLVGGWFDAEDLAGTLGTYDAISRQNPTIQTTLVMGPWAHGGWIRTKGKSLGAMDFQAPTAEYFREQIAFPFFEHYLKDGPAAELTKAVVFQTGSNRWIRENAWPAANAVKRSLYLHANGKLSFDAPAAAEQPYDEYVSDPKSPVPYLEHSPTDLGSEFMYADQRFAGARRDVLSYTSEPLQEDLTLLGPVSPHLQVSTSGTDSDFDVKIIDVYPAGYQQLVRGEPMRAKFRNSWSQPEAMIPGQITAVGFQMPDIDHTFRRGHRVMVQIQSSWFPLTDLNPQTFVDAAAATTADFVKATERVYHTPEAASEVRILAQP